MPGRWRQIRDRARFHVHEHMKVRAAYVPPGGGAAVDCWVRVHPAIDLLTDPPGTAFDYAQRWETVSKIVFWREEVVPARNGIVALTADEAYRIDHVEPVNGLTVEARVTRLSEAEAAALPYPGK